MPQAGCMARNPKQPPAEAADSLQVFTRVFWLCFIENAVTQGVSLEKSESEKLASSGFGVFYLHQKLLSSL